MSTTSSPAFDVWEVVDGLREAFTSRGPGRMGRGDIRTAILAVLAEEPMHGYQIIRAIGDRTHGAWKPSPGSIYPTLQLLADEGLVTAVDDHGKRVFSLTDEGRTAAEARVAAAGNPWDAIDGDRGDSRELRSAMRDLHLAAKQVGMTGSRELVERATAVLVNARKELYRLLADA